MKKESGRRTSEASVVPEVTAGSPTVISSRYAAILLGLVVADA